MSSSRGKNLSKKAALGYSQFGTGVLDQDDYDALRLIYLYIKPFIWSLRKAWEEVYEHEGDKSNYHAALKDEDDDGPQLAVEDRPSSRTVAAGELPGFVKAERRDEETQNFSRWFPPAVWEPQLLRAKRVERPRQYKGLHLIDISPLQELHLSVSKKESCAGGAGRKRGAQEVVGVSTEVRVSK